MIGKDISRLQAIINQLETARNNELEKEKELTNSLKNDNTNTILENTVSENNITNSVE